MSTYVTTMVLFPNHDQVMGQHSLLYIIPLATVIPAALLFTVFLLLRRRRLRRLQQCSGRTFRISEESFRSDAPPRPKPFGAPQQLSPPPVSIIPVVTQRGPKFSDARGAMARMGIIVPPPPARVKKQPWWRSWVRKGV